MAGHANSHHKDALVRTAVALFRKQGYAATGINQILEVSGAPKGSLYYYFPQGKTQIGAAAITLAGETVRLTLEELAATSQTTGILIERYFRLMADWMSASNFTDGSPVATILLEMAPTCDPIRAQGVAAYEAWIDVIAAKAQGEGMPRSQARRSAQLVVSAIDGALIQCRVHRTEQPLLEVATMLAGLFVLV